MLKSINAKVCLSIMVLTLLSSCKYSSLTKRHYTHGFYYHHQSNKNNLASNSRKNTLIEKAANPDHSFNPSVEKERVNSITTNEVISNKKIPKDSIVFTIKKGQKRTERFFKSDNNYDIIVIKRENRPDGIKKSNSSVRLATIKKHKLSSIIALCVSVIPVLGLIFSLMVKNKQKYLLEHDEMAVVEESKKFYKPAIIISTIITVLFALIAGFILLAIASTPVL